MPANGVDTRQLVFASCPRAHRNVQPMARTTTTGRPRRTRRPRPTEELTRRPIKPRLTYATPPRHSRCSPHSAGCHGRAMTLPKDSVGSQQLQANAVTTKNVRDGSLLARDFKRRELPRGQTALTRRNRRPRRPRRPRGPRSSGLNRPQGRPGRSRGNGRGRPHHDHGHPRRRPRPPTDPLRNWRARPQRRGATQPKRNSLRLQQSFPVGDNGGILAHGGTPTGWESLIQNTDTSQTSATGDRRLREPIAHVRGPTNHHRPGVHC